MAKYERVKFVGPRTADGRPERFLAGVPARDMDGDEWYALPAELRESAERLGLYEGVVPKRKPNDGGTPAAPGEGGG
jgi:hypothetical protein